MPRKLLIIVVWLMNSVPSAFGGIVLYSPPEIHAQPGQTTAAVAIALLPAPTGGLVDAFDVLFDSEQVRMTDFVFSDFVIMNFPNRFVGDSIDFMFYPQPGIYVYANRSSPLVLPPTGLPLGVLELDFAGLPYSSTGYRVQVNSEIDQGLSALLTRGVSDPLRGELRVFVVPEPESILLFFAGLVWLLRGWPRSHP